MKTIQEMIDVMKAFEEGKEIQYYSYVKQDRKDIIKKPKFNWGQFDYRIKPKEPTYRPYESVDEMVEDYEKRFQPNTNRPKYTMPLIWVRGIATNLEGVESIICGFNKKTQDVWVGGVYWLNMKAFFDKFAYLDGTPCGKLVEE